MLQIKREQMLAFIESDEAFANWFVNEYMREEMPDRLEIGEDSLKEMVLNGRRYAEGFGLTDVESQANFVMLMFSIGPDFFRFDGFRQALEERHMTDMGRIEAIYEHVTEEQADYAMSYSDSRYWYPELLLDEGEH